MKPLVATKVGSLIAVLLCLAFMQGGAVAPAHAIQKVSMSSSSLTMSPGDDSVITIRLDSPIICPSGTVTCDVTLDFASAFPAGISVTPSSVTWTAGEWSQVRTVTVGVDVGATLTMGQTYTSSATVASASNFYSGFQPALAIEIPDTSTPTPIEDPDPVDVAYNLAGTGSDSSGLIMVGAGILVLGAFIRIISVKKSK